MGDVLAAALWLADAATEGKKVITGMLITGLVFASVPIVGELAKYFRHHRHYRP